MDFTPVKNLPTPYRCHREPELVVSFSYCLKNSFQNDISITNEISTHVAWHSFAIAELVFWDEFSSTWPLKYMVSMTDKKKKKEKKSKTTTSKTCHLVIYSPGCARGNRKEPYIQMYSVFPRGYRCFQMFVCLFAFFFSPSAFWRPVSKAFGSLCQIFYPKKNK